MDDFAIKRGHRYVTVLVDCQTGKAVDLLLGRDAEPLADWLRAHPDRSLSAGIEVVLQRPVTLMTAAEPITDTLRYVDRAASAKSSNPISASGVTPFAAVSVMGYSPPKPN